LTKANMEDRNSVIGFLRSSQENSSQVTAESDPDELRQKIEAILKNFAGDGEVCFLIALLYEQIGSIRDALSMISGSPVSSEFYNAHMLAVRSRLFYKAGEKEKAADNLRLMLDADNAEFETFIDAFTRIEQLAPDLFDMLPTSAALSSLSEHEQLFVANQLDGDLNQVAVQTEILERLWEKCKNSTEDFVDGVTHLLAVAYISSGKCALAAGLLEKHLSDNRNRISTVFNLAMAKWVTDFTPTVELFKKVDEINSSSGREVSTDPNYAQCMAIVNFVLGNIEKGKNLLEIARSIINERPRREFSAWSYRREEPKNFLKHLDEIEAFGNGAAVFPEFAGKD